MSIASKLLGFVTGGLPTEIAKQVGENIKAKGDRAFKAMMQEIAFDLELLKAGTGDPLHTRQVIALTFHFFVWGQKFWTGSFPNDVIIVWKDTDVTVMVVYCLIILFYFPFRAIERVFKK